jgi:hypothetical protein
MIQRCAGAEEDVRSWHKFPDDGFTERQKHSESRPSGNGEIDPDVWSGRASQEGLSSWLNGLA